jgi:hypothetical protein
MGAAQWGTQRTSVGIKRPVLTGMIKIADIGVTDFTIAGLAPDSTGRYTYRLQDLGLLQFPSLNIAQGQATGAKTSDWVAFSVTLGRVGRRHDPILTGPDGETVKNSSQSIIYQMADLPGGESPRTSIQLPAFTLGTPTKSGLAISFSGAAECQNPSAPTQTTFVDIKAQHQYLDDLLAVFGKDCCCRTLG